MNWICTRCGSDDTFEYAHKTFREGMSIRVFLRVSCRVCWHKQDSGTETVRFERVESETCL